QELAFYAPDRRMILRFPSPFLRSEPTILELEDEERGLPWRHEVVASHEEAFKLELRGFYESMTEGKAPLTSGEESRYARRHTALPHRRLAVPSPRSSIRVARLL